MGRTFVIISLISFATPISAFCASLVLTVLIGSLWLLLFYLIKPAYEVALPASILRNIWENGNPQVGSVVEYDVAMPRESTSLQNLRKLSCLKGIYVSHQIGGGGGGEVFCARHSSTGRYFALKTVHGPRFTKSEEARLGSLLSGFPFIATTYFGFRESTCLAIAMEYIPGENLAQILKRCAPLPESACKFFVTELVLALEHVHSFGIMHRDVKPANILVESSGHIKLGDFGCATRAVRSREFCGTMEYMAPEVIMPLGNGFYDSRVDWWALGVLLFEMQAGYLPFGTRDDGQNVLFHRICAGLCLWPEEQMPGQVSGKAKDFVLSTLEVAARRIKDADVVRSHAWFAEVRF
ncbi:kinase-like protein [Cylindrobasidium torrendii FP15055 ss-10]|uniref:cAMP-dependent protein kinase n=1 Tax=Cylindrobasidium torrendii FP15055 ss-10 TaxID=1314674 RepID=A0A0D7AST9_9AGAR|nr:kinase-like protein [Cylindrobasidium torrendii FP15055 ss-10]